MLGSDGSATISGSTFVENEAQDSGGGVAFDGFFGLEIRDSLFRRNRAAVDGGGVWCRAPSGAVLINDVFDQNRAGRDGGGLFVAVGDATVIHGSFSGNEAGGAGDAIAAGPNGSVTVINSILWKNGQDEIGGSGTVSVSYSDVRGGFPGAGNVNIDPRFVNACAGDLHLRESSPVRDAGIDTGSLPETDLDGNPRIQGTAPDMGAYELPAREHCPANGWGH